MSKSKPSRDKKKAKRNTVSVPAADAGRVKGGATTSTDSTLPGYKLKPISPRTIIPCV